MPRATLALVTAGSLTVLSGCSPSYSPNTYDAVAVQQANAVQRGVVIGVRQVKVSANAAVGTVTGAAAGGIAGSTVDGGGPVKAFSTLGGSVVGGLIGSGVQHAEGDTTAVEYIVRETNNNLVSVTQRDKTPLPIGQNVLVIAGKQARIVADYTVSVPNTQPPESPAAAARPSGAEQATGPGTPVPPSGVSSGGSAAQKPEAASAAAAGPTQSPGPPSSSASSAGGQNSHAAATGGGAAATGATAAAVAAALAAPSGSPRDPGAATPVPGGPAAAGTVAVPPAAATADPAAPGGTSGAAAAPKKPTAPSPP